MKSLLLFVSLGIMLSSIDVASVRAAFREAADSKTNTLLLQKRLEKVNKKDNAILVAYKGAASIMASKYLKNKQEKKESFTLGVELIEYAIQQKPSNVEIKFIRLTLQQNIPKFLKYNAAIEADKAFIFSHFKTLKPKDLKRHIKDYILQSKLFSEEEKNVISRS